MTLLPRGLARSAGAGVLALAIAAQAFAAQALPAQGELADAINAIRLHGCGGRMALSRPLHSARKLDEAARRAAAGTRLPDALLAVGYSAVQSAAIHVATTGGDLATARLLENHFCHASAFLGRERLVFGNELFRAHKNRIAPNALRSR